MRWRYLLAIIVSWLLITTPATALHCWVWMAAPGADGSPSIVEGSWPKEVSGLLMMIALPGWGLVSKVLYLPAAQVIWLTAAAYASGFGLWAVTGAIGRSGPEIRFETVWGEDFPRSRSGGCTWR